LLENKEVRMYFYDSIPPTVYMLIATEDIKIIRTHESIDLDNPAWYY